MSGSEFTRDGFAGDFDALPIRANVLFGAVPEHPVAGDFEHAVSQAFGADDVAADWRVEAIRWRRQNPGRCLDLRAAAEATSRRILRLAGVGA